MIKSGALDKAVSLTGVLATKGAKAAIEAAGGSVADVVAVVRPKKLPAKPAKTADA